MWDISLKAGENTKNNIFEEGEQEEARRGDGMHSTRNSPPVRNILVLCYV